ncbi:MAG: hypothetical protein ACYC6O_01030 [Thermoleophilia bacterium]
MSLSLILGLSLGLVVGAPLYYAYLIFKKKRERMARRNSEENTQGELVKKEEQESQEK